MNQKQKLRYWQKRIFFTSWITYAFFYLCRVNMSVAMPGIMAEFGLSKTTMGLVLTALFAFYAVGQFVNGQLGDKFGARRLISIGILFSAVLNIIFGFTNGLVASMILIWGLNGFFQSMGWAPTVKTIANWFSIKQRGKVSGLLGTSYQIGSAISLALAGLIVGLFGWRWAFWIPAGIFLLIGIHFLIRTRNAPEEVGLPTVEEQANGKYKAKEIRKDHHLGFKYTLKKVFTSPTIWVVAFSLFALNIVRYGFLGWAPTYLFEVQNASISTAAYKTLLIPLIGSFGAVFAGWASTKFFNLRKAPIAVIMLILLGIAAWIFPFLPSENWILGLIILATIGFMTYGPHVMIVTAMPMDIGSRKAASSVTGFIDAMGYAGAAITGVVSGLLIDKISWNAAFSFWVAAAFFAAILMACLWKVKPRKGQYH